MKNKQHPQSGQPQVKAPRTHMDYLFGEIQAVFNPKTDILVMSLKHYDDACERADSRWIKENVKRIVIIRSLDRPSIVRTGGSLNFTGGFFKQ
jgi:hypothetical protein